MCHLCCSSTTILKISGSLWPVLLIIANSIFLGTSNIDKKHRRENGYQNIHLIGIIVINALLLLIFILRKVYKENKNRKKGMQKVFFYIRCTMVIFTAIAVFIGYSEIKHTIYRMAGCE